MNTVFIGFVWLVQIQSNVVKVEFEDVKMSCKFCLLSITELMKHVERVKKTGEYPAMCIYCKATIEDLADRRQT